MILAAKIAVFPSNIFIYIFLDVVKNLSSMGGMTKPESPPHEIKLHTPQ